MRRASTVLFAAGALVLAAAPAARAGVNTSTGEPYNIDIFYGPVFGSTRIIGLGGAYTAIAEGAEGVLYNPAAVANRYRYSLKWWDYDLGFDYYFFLLGDKTDFDNNRDTRYFSVRQIMFFLAPALHFGPFSISVNWIRQSFSLGGSRLLDAGNLNLDVVHVAMGYRFFEGALVLGVGARFGSLTVRDRVLATAAGTFRPEIGVLWRPASLPFRFGLAARTSAIACPPELRVVDRCELSTDFGLQRVILPWEVSIGAAFSFGPRVFNRPWKNARTRAKVREAEVREAREDRTEALRALLNDTPPEERAKVARAWDAREKEIRGAEDRLTEAWEDHVAEHDKARLRAEERLHTVVTVDLLVTGGVPEALGIEAAATNAARERSVTGYVSPGFVALPPRDARTTFSPRLGVETEVWHDRLKIRAGTYLEPARSMGTRSRLHGTAGVELRLFYFTPPILLPRFGVRAGATGDFAPRYINLSVSVGIWH